MQYSRSVEEVCPFTWGISPILKGLAFERAHMEGKIRFVDNRKYIAGKAVKIFP
jgi:hypothetical protein